MYVFWTTFARFRLFLSPIDFRFINSSLFLSFFLSQDSRADRISEISSNRRSSMTDVLLRFVIYSRTIFVI